MAIVKLPHLYYQECQGVLHTALVSAGTQKDTILYFEKGQLIMEKEEKI